MNVKLNKIDWPFSSKSKYYKFFFHNWHLQDIGTNKKPIVLLIHGTGASTHSWRLLIPFLLKNFRVINIDLPGHGFTKIGSKNRSSLKYIPEDMHNLLKYLEIEPEIIIAHSAGVPIAINYALISHKSPKLIISINGAVSKFDGVANIFFPIFAKILSISPFVSNVVKSLLKSSKVLDDFIYSTGSTLDQESKRYYKTLLSNTEHINGILTMISQWNLNDLLENFDELNIPILFLLGENDKTVKPQSVINFVKKFNNVETKLVRKYGHLMHEESPEIIYHHIKIFLLSKNYNLYE